MLGPDQVKSALDDLASAKLDEKLRLTLEYLAKVTRGTATVDDVRALRAAGLSRARIEDALAVCFSFNTITRLADTFAFVIPPQSGFDFSAKMLLSRGYNL